MKRIQVEVPLYSREEGIRLEWDTGFQIAVSCRGESVALKANQAGLVSLARLLLTLAQENVPVGYHVHLDESNSLEDDSVEFLIEKS